LQVPLLSRLQAGKQPAAGSQPAPHGVVNISDLRDLAKRRVPRAVFDYVDGGAEGEVTLRENIRAFEEVVFQPRHAVYTPQPDARATVLGSPLAFPALLAPCGFTRLYHPSGEVAVARAAGAAGIGYMLSTFSGYPVEEVRKATTGPLWYQLYLPGGRKVAETTIDRVKKAGFTALAVTIDTNIHGMRERDLRNGIPQLMGKRLLPKLPFLPQILARPGWLTRFLAAKNITQFPNILLSDGPLRAPDVHRLLTQTVVTWADLKWIREAWPGPILVKGVITADDARRSLDAGAAAVVVSNHGGRQLDGVAASLRALPEIVEVVNGQAEVLMDGGVRRGSDIVKAICLGAKAVLVGRAYAYGLAAAGQAGVERAIEILRADVDRTLILLGCKCTGELNGSFVSKSW
jgi:isopentenyl diphosphate isomerase/L-lactate dehydrogenase-like FMN-dependent dehydrogenase